MKYFFRFIFVVLSAILSAINIKTFIYTAGLLPGGFSGVTLLIQEIVFSWKEIKIPFSVVYWLLNTIPAIICFRYVGKKFTLYSVLMILVSGFLTDYVPAIKVTNDILLCAVFGGIIQGISACICFSVGATSGGTDFISIYVSEKTGKSAWNYIFIGNCVLLVIFGFLFGWERALYSIIFQYVTTQVINILFMRYKKTTLFIISDKTEEIYMLIKETTNHDATVFSGIGCYKGCERKMLYTVISSDEVSPLISKIKFIDENSFINVLQSKDIHGRFFMRKND
ncbi:MAG: YitT family protein [Treponema sp.]|nr:YitT family protein [Treponema sp.]MBQ7882441.1 YitT family protein [Treponema sp.]